MSLWWDVECTGEVREVYSVQADSAEEAMAKWAETGILDLQESSSVEPVSARLSGT